DVVVVGGGVIGLVSAWRLAQRGASVVVVDPAPGSGATGVAAGMLAPVTEARLGEEPLLRLNLASWARWPSFAEEVAAAAGRSVGYRADGTLMVALDADDRVVLDDLAARHRVMGLEVTELRGRAARALEPGLSPRVRSGLLAASERSVDPAALGEALLDAATAAGARLVRGAVDHLVGEGIHGPDDGGGPARRVTGVAVHDPGGTHGAGPRGEIRATTVVLAAGCRSGTLAGLPDHVRPPVRPVKGQILTLRQPVEDPLVTHTVRGIVQGSSIYLVPRDDGRVVVGATVEERGWDTTPTAGGGYVLLRDALALVPGLDDAELVAVRSGLRPGSPDDLPMIGPSGVDGLVVATGHHRNGILLTPVTGDAVAAVVAGDPVPEEALACDPRRFAGTSTARAETARSETARSEAERSEAGR
ncbi:MAG TPA: FAD-dependent oxidoreductase, partial [Acidimicrobiales bacterium]|nr:FAD-dependent oxidoreductase [Acidimicrobiales bacterium]